MPRPCFNQAVLDLALPQWAKFALARKWEAGEREHRGTTEDMAEPDFDPIKHQAAEALDIILYWLGYWTPDLMRGAADRDLSEIGLAILQANAQDAATILKRCGQTAAHAAATEALNRASI